MRLTKDSWEVLLNIVDTSSTKEEAKAQVKALLQLHNDKDIRMSMKMIGLKFPIDENEQAKSIQTMIEANYKEEPKEDEGE